MLYRKPIGEITWEDVVEFCEQQIPEGGYLDYKEDFPSKLEKTIAALANTLGGLILIGVEEDQENKPVLPVKGIEFKRGLSERITNIILTNIAPPIFPEIQVCLNSDKSRAIIVIRIHPSEHTPHAISSNTQVYLRTGNRNKPESLAGVDQIEWLSEKRQKSVTLRQQLSQEAERRFRRQYGRRFLGSAGSDSIMLKGLFTLSLCPLYPKDYFCNPPELNQVVSDLFVRDYFRTDDFFPITRHRNGEIVKNGITLVFLEKDMAYYTELNSFGLYYYRQILQSRYKPPGNQDIMMIMRATEMFARLDEFIDSGNKFYKNLSYYGPLRFEMELDSILDYALGPYPEQDLLYSLEDQIHFDENLLAGTLEERKFELIYGAVRRIGWAFGLDISEGLLKKFYVQYKR